MEGNPHPLKEWGQTKKLDFTLLATDKSFILIQSGVLTAFGQISFLFRNVLLTSIFSKLNAYVSSFK